MDNELTWLEEPNGLRIPRPNAISGDGQTVAGLGIDQSGNRVGACIWQKSTGVRTLAAVLTESSVDFTNWTLDDAFDVSADGRVIVGTGTNPDGYQEAWICRLK